MIFAFPEVFILPRSLSQRMCVDFTRGERDGRVMLCYCTAGCIHNVTQTPKANTDHECFASFFYFRVPSNSALSAKWNTTVMESWCCKPMTEAWHSIRSRRSATNGRHRRRRRILACMMYTSKRLFAHIEIYTPRGFPIMRRANNATCASKLSLRNSMSRSRTQS